MAAASRSWILSCGLFYDWVEILGVHHLWTALSGKWEILGDTGNCRDSSTFGIDTDSFFSTVVGNSDATDVITDSIDKFQWRGKVGAQGYIGCDNGFEDAATDWAAF